jgi:hypothetical protein
VVAAPPGADVTGVQAGHHYCVVAELKRRVGDDDAAEWYERAIAAAPDEPGYELWYGAYLRNARGAAGPHVEQAERHYYRAIAKLEQRRRAGSPPEFDAVTEDWVQKDLLSLYQTDGQPLLPGRSYRYGSDGAGAPGLFLSSILSTSYDTHGFFHDSEARNFTSEAAFAASTLRLDRPLTPTELFYLVRTPLRVELYNRVRFRENRLGAIDLTHHYFSAKKAQINDFSDPNRYVDVDVTELGVGYSRMFDLYPVLDLNLDLGWRRTTRSGTVEFMPEQEESFNTWEVAPTLSRFIGQDKLSLNLVYVRMDIRDLMAGPPEERARGETIMAATIDYALYRSVVLPKLDQGSLRLGRRYTRGWHFFAGVAQDDALYGLREVTRRDVFAGTRLEGLGDYDITLQETLYSSATYFIDATRPELGVLEDGTQANAQLRTTAVIARRLLDEDAHPGVPRSTAGFAPASLVFVVPASVDVAVQGADSFENVRIGGEFWLKVIGTGLGGTTFLVTAGYDFQWFHNMSRSVHMGHLDVRMGW